MSTSKETAPPARLSRRHLVMALAAAPALEGCITVPYADYGRPVPPGSNPHYPPEPRALPSQVPSTSCDWSWEQDSFVKLVNWYLREVLGPTKGPQLRTANAPSMPDRPMPCGDNFHDQCGSIYVIQGVTLSSIRSSRYGFHVAVNDYLRADTEELIPAFKDLNTVELRTCWALRTKHDGPMLFPCGLRFLPGRREQFAFVARCRQRGLDPGDYELHYCRPFNDGQSAYLSFGIQSRLEGTTDLLV